MLTKYALIAPAMELTYKNLYKLNGTATVLFDTEYAAREFLALQKAENTSYFKVVSVNVELPTEDKLKSDVISMEKLELNITNV